MRLEQVAFYSKEKIGIQELQKDTYVSNENLLQAKGGLKKAEKLPKTPASVIRFDEKDILIGNIRPYLKKIWFADRSGGASSDVLTLKVKEGFHPKFVYYALLRDEYFDFAMSGSKGSKMPRGDKSHILTFPIPDFEFDLQVRIASILSDIDSKIELNNKINAELESMAKLIYDYWFVQFDFPDENEKPYKSSGGKMVYNDELKREIPEGWKVVAVTDYMDLQYGFPFKTALFNNEKNGVPVVRIRDILKNTISLYSTEDTDTKYALNKGDLIIGMDGNFHLNFWDKDDCYLNQRCVRIRKNTPSDLSMFQVLYSIEPYIKAREKNVSRTTVGHLSAKDINSLRLILPPKNIQLKGNALFDSSLDKLITNRNENRKLEELRDWLLPMLMNGQVTIKD